VPASLISNLQTARPSTPAGVLAVEAVLDLEVAALRGRGVVLISKGEVM
jgi:hypothetical protein